MLLFMRKKFILLVLLFGSHFCFSQKNDFTVQPFLPEIITQFPNVRDFAVSGDETEIYFTAQSYLGEASAIITCKQVNGKWHTPQVAPFSGMYQDMEPFLTADGLNLYFVSNRPIVPRTIKSKDFDIWVVKRKDANSAWSLPENIGSPVNTAEDEFYPTVSQFNNLCFTRDGAGSKGKDDIFYCKWKDGKYAEPVSMNDSINSDGYEFNAFLANDESFIMYTCYNKKGGSGSGDLYISYKRTNNEWGNGENLGPEINSAQMDYCPYVNEKSGMMYFTSKRSTVKKQFDKNQNITEFLKEVNKYDNGQSRIYRMNINNLLKKKN